MKKSDVQYLIVASGFNCQEYVLKCVESIKAQTYKNFIFVMVDDGSKDGTALKCMKAMDDNIKSASPITMAFEHHNKNEGAAKRRFEVINKYAKHEEIVVVLVGLDDELFPNALEVIKKQYDNGKWMSYGNWKNQHGVMLPDGFLHFDEETHKARDYRKVKYRSTAPNTFKRFLFDKIPAEDFKLNGKWIDSTTESELMFSCLEMCGKERIGVIEEPIYLYNEALPGGTLNRLGRNYKYKIYNQIIQRPKKLLLIR